MFLSSLSFALPAKRKIWQTTETYSPQTFSVTAAVVAPAVVICLNSLVSAVGMALFCYVTTRGLFQFQAKHLALFMKVNTG